jgi:hypothetical protein
MLLGLILIRLILSIPKLSMYFLGKVPERYTSAYVGKQT